ncbi:DUF5916 domain-containing protein [candidate division KSB1 bacterium]
MKINLAFKFLLFVLLFSAANAHSQQSALENFDPDKSVINIIKTEENIRIDGVLNENIWQKAQKVELNYEFNPGNNVKPKVKTEVYFVYDESNLYMGFICHETDIKQLRANLTERDRMFQDDFMGIILDTYNDLKKAYEIFINPFGVQGDVIWTPSNEDDSYDMIYYSAANILADRWVGEMKIPFKSLSFPQTDIQEWRILVYRNRPRSSREQIAWTPIDRNNPALLAQAGWLKGIRGVERGRFLNLLPYTVASNYGAKEDFEVPDSEFRTGKIKSDIGMGIKYGLTSNLNLDFVYNPDFSQVESDATQIDVNTTNALFYPERRPFFQEGSETFNTLLHNDLVYTRTINNPSFAAKLTGKVGKVKLGFISSYDRNALSNILRLKYDLGGESYIGTFITNREEEDGYNRVASLDGSIQFSENYYWDFQLSGSKTREPDSPEIYEDNTVFSKNGRTATFDGEKFSGMSFFTALRKKSEYLNASMLYIDYSPSFRAANGYVASNNYRYYEIDFNFMSYPNGKLVDYYNISPEFAQEYNHQNQLKNQRFENTFYIIMKKQTEFVCLYEYENKRFNDIMFKNLYTASFSLSSQPSKYINCGLDYNFGRDIYRTSEEPRKAFSKSISSFIDWKPLSNVSIGAEYHKYKLDELNNAGNIFNGYTIRGNFNYQYNRNLYFRLISQYNSFSKDYELDPLIRYKLNPFTIFYIGSTYDFKSFDGSNGLTKMQRQYFMKFQYLIQK